MQFVFCNQTLAVDYSATAVVWNAILGVDENKIKVHGFHVNSKRNYKQT